MINLDQIEEWIQEVEQRPASAPLIIQYIAKRLRDLSARNEELLGENIELRSGRKVEEYESRIANLEYQLDILKRQFNSDNIIAAAPVDADTLSLILYNSKGRVLRIQQPVQSLVPGMTVGEIQAVEGGGPVRLLVTNPAEELLFVFDSGRTIALPVSEIPSAVTSTALVWSEGYLAEPRGGEELATVLPIARMSLFDYCVQTSRRGCAKKMMKTSFESHISKDFVGAGIKSKPDKTCDMVLTGRDDLLVVSTKEGFLCALDVSQLPYTIEEIVKLGPTDYIVSSFIAGNKPSFLVVTENGKVIHREMGWIDKANSFKSRGQALFSQARRDAGIRVAGSVAVTPEDWGLSLANDGRLVLHSAADLIAEGTLFGKTLDNEQVPGILEFTSFTAAITRNSNEKK